MLLDRQKETLTEELGARRALVLALAAAVEAQHKICERLGADLQECSGLADRVEAWMNE